MWKVKIYKDQIIEFLKNILIAIILTFVRSMENSLGLGQSMVQAESTETLCCVRAEGGGEILADRVVQQMTALLPL